MPLYERRLGADKTGPAKVVERVRTVPGSFEDTRLGLLHQDREEHKLPDGWHLVDDRPAAQAPATGKPKDSGGG